MKITPEYPFTLPLPELPILTKPLIMNWISPGTFRMGSLPHELGYMEEETAYQASLSQGYWMSQYLITQAQWQTMMNTNPSHFSDCPDCPIENISWSESLAFAQSLNEKYANDLPLGFQFTLPTETQWEYACRAGSQTLFYNGDALTQLTQIAWHKENSLGKTHPVGQKEPNRWGLYDMLGNVFEWCYDSPSEYPNGSATDWVGNGKGMVRTIRSASWKTPPTLEDFRCACRAWIEPEQRCAWLGFRICLSRKSL